MVEAAEAAAAAAAPLVDPDYVSESEPPEAECCLCYETEKPMLTDEAGNWLSITEFAGEIPDGVMLLGPCRRHVVCKSCVVQVLSSTDPPFITAQRNRVPCLKAGAPCVNRAGAPCYFSDAEVAKLLPEALLQRYNADVERFSLPGYELLRCPGCASLVPLPANAPEVNMFGDYIVTCNQNAQCRQRFCYHCGQLCADPRARRCTVCSGHANSNHPKALNHYFYKPERRPTDTACPLWRNEELSVELCLAQLKEMIDIDKSEFSEHGRAANTVHAMRCFACMQGFIKSQDCNGMSHCGIERCYVCGFSMAARGQTLPFEHWANCPRFDNSPYWNQVAKCKYRCTAGVCYGHNKGECQVASHKPGLRKMHLERRKIQLCRAFTSLPPALQQEIRARVAAQPAGNARLATQLKKLPKV